MSRMEETMRKMKEIEDAAIRAEIECRANAARDLLEPFDMGGVKFKPGIDFDYIEIMSGLARLLEAYPEFKLVSKENRVSEYFKRGVTTYIFEYNGVKFRYDDYDDALKLDIKKHEATFDEAMQGA